MKKAFRAVWLNIFRRVYDTSPKGQPQSGCTPFLKQLAGGVAFLYVWQSPESPLPLQVYICGAAPVYKRCFSS